MPQVNGNVPSPAPELPPIPPETKDWTVVIEQGCGQCGFDPGFDPATTGARLRDSIPRWERVLAHGDVAVRPQPVVWSPLEYACHVRDVCRIFRGRLEMMLREDDPVYPNWDQDEAAVADAYNAQDPSAVSRQYAREAGALASAFDAVKAGEWARTGRRGDGRNFTVRSFATYFLHDIEHHLHDVEPAAP